MNSERLNFAFIVMNKYINKYSNADMIDYYDLFGFNRLTKTSLPSELKKMLLTFHPDNVKQIENAVPEYKSCFLEISKLLPDIASILEDPVRKHEYDKKLTSYYAKLYEEQARKKSEEIVKVKLKEEVVKRKEEEPKEDKIKEENSYDEPEADCLCVASDSIVYPEDKDIVFDYVNEDCDDCLWDQNDRNIRDFVRAVNININKNGIPNACLMVDYYFQFGIVKYFTNDGSSRDIARNLDYNEVRKSFKWYFKSNESSGYGELIVEKIMDQKVEALNTASLETFKKYGEEQLKNAVLTLYYKGIYNQFTKENGVRSDLIKIVNPTDLVIVMSRAVNIPNIYNFGYARQKEKINASELIDLYVDYIKEVDRRLKVGW